MTNSPSREEWEDKLQDVIDIYLKSFIRQLLLSQDSELRESLRQLITHKKWVEEKIDNTTFWHRIDNSASVASPTFANAQNSALDDILDLLNKNK